MRSSKASKLPKALSLGEETFAMHCRVKLHPVNQPVREYRFDEVRLWRFDFCWPSLMIAVEVEGIKKFIFGRHQQKEGYTKDLEKYNAATLAGWKVLRYSTEMVIAGTAINDVLEMMK